tara:strand:- start:226 stop:1260 length:1035 start_codon:yes stop_codon:yes gene_type:complete
LELIAQYLPSDPREPLGALDIALLTNALERKGANVDGLMKELGIIRCDWTGHDAVMSFSDKLRLFRAVCHLYPDEGIGLLAGEQASLNHFGVLGYAIRTSPSVLEAVKTGFKYLRLNGPLFLVQLLVDENRAIIHIEEAMDIGDLLPFCSEFFLTAVIAIYHQLTGQKLTLLNLKLPYAETAYLKRYQQAFECPIQFNQPHIELSIPLESLHLPIAKYDAIALSHSLRSCQSVIETLESPESLVQQIKLTLYQQPMELPTLEQIAQNYGCSSRTLRRELAKHGVSFQSLRSEAICNLATEMLLQTELTVDEIGFRLGYSDSANFRRAFRSWTKLTPSALRNQLK